MKKKVSQKLLEEKARSMTQEALKDRVLPKNINLEELLLQMHINGEERIFELSFLHSPDPKEAILLARVRINEFTGNGKVETFIPQK